MIQYSTALLGLECARRISRISPYEEGKVFARLCSCYNKSAAIVAREVIEWITFQTEESNDDFFEGMRAGIGTPPLDGIAGVYRILAPALNGDGGPRNKAEFGLVMLHTFAKADGVEDPRMIEVILNTLRNGDWAAALDLLLSAAADHLMK